MSEVEARWTEIVEDLKRSLQEAKEGIAQREQLFDSAERDLKAQVKHLQSTTRVSDDQSERRVIELSKELEVAQAAKKDGETKLRGALKRNEQLLAELRELGDAVRALQQDRQVQETTSSQQVRVLREFIGETLKKNNDRALSTLYCFARIVATGDNAAAFEGHVKQISEV